VTTKSFKPAASPVCEFDRATPGQRLHGDGPNPRLSHNQWSQFSGKLASFAGSPSNAIGYSPLNESVQLPLHVDFRVRLGFTEVDLGRRSEKAST
jgi:hypothetical protein